MASKTFKQRRQLALAQTLRATTGCEGQLSFAGQQLNAVSREVECTLEWNGHLLSIHQQMNRLRNQIQMLTSDLRNLSALAANENLIERFETSKKISVSSPNESTPP